MLGWGMTVSLRPRWSEGVCVWGAAVRGGGRYVIVWSIVGMSVGYCLYMCGCGRGYTYCMFCMYCMGDEL